MRLFTAAAFIPGPFRDIMKHMHGRPNAISAAVASIVDQIFVTQGDEVYAGDLLASVKIDGHSHELICPVSGSIQKIVVHKGDRVRANELLFEIKT